LEPTVSDFQWVALDLGDVTLLVLAFGPGLVAVGVSLGALRAEWLAVISVALTASFALAAVLSARSNHLYNRHRERWQPWQSDTRLADDALLDIGEPCRGARRTCARGAATMIALAAARMASGQSGSRAPGGARSRSGASRVSSTSRGRATASRRA
jgi:hypothetical protein